MRKVRPWRRLNFFQGGVCLQVTTLGSLLLPPALLCSLAEMNKVAIILECAGGDVGRPAGQPAVAAGAAVLARQHAAALRRPAAALPGIAVREHR